MSTGVLIAGVIAGAFSMGLVVYGKKQQKPISLFAGIGLGIVPMVAHSALVILGLTVATVAGVVWGEKQSGGPIV
ncbi:MAG: hypothetical protein RBS39_10160 [Phycisphaerales bacterium]|nr:hypothetical protein [Phycisphaerales bacterium]